MFVDWFFLYGHWDFDVDEDSLKVILFVENIYVKLTFSTNGNMKWGFVNTVCTTGKALVKEVVRVSGIVPL